MTPKLAIALLLTGVVPVELMPRDDVDVVEVNHYYCPNGKLVFSQAIFWQWHASERRYHVRAWRIIKRPSQLPQRDWSRRVAGAEPGWYCVWDDGGELREVRAESYRETWTQWDVELAEREVLPKHLRRELSAQEARP